MCSVDLAYMCMAYVCIHMMLWFSHLYLCVLYLNILFVKINSSITLYSSLVFIFYWCGIETVYHCHLKVYWQLCLFVFIIQYMPCFLNIFYNPNPFRFFPFWSLFAGVELTDFRFLGEDLRFTSNDPILHSMFIVKVHITFISQLYMCPVGYSLIIYPFGKLYTFTSCHMLR